MSRRKPAEVPAGAILELTDGAWHGVAASDSSGDRLRRDLAVDGQPYDITRMIEEAARISDRLDGMDRLLSGDAELWMSITEVRGGLLEVRVDNVMMEARQSAAILRQLLAEIHKRQTEASAGDDDDADPTADL